MRHRQVTNRDADRPEIREVYEPEDADLLREELLDAKLVFYDTEWTGYDDSRTNVNNGLVFCASFCWRAGDKVNLVFLHNYPKARGGVSCNSSGNLLRLAPWFESPDHLKSCHNVPVDAHATMNHGINVRGFSRDTMVADFILDERRENRHGLKECVEDHFGIVRKSFKELFWPQRLRADGQPYASGQREKRDLSEAIEDSAAWDILVPYSCDDAWDGMQLYDFYQQELSKLPWIGEKTQWDYFLERASPHTDTIHRMERRGMYLDIPFMQEMSELCKKDLDEMEAKALEWANCPMNIGSGLQLGMLLYGKGPQPIYKGTGKNKKVLYNIPGMGFPVLRQTEKGAPSTKAEHLIELQAHLEREKKYPPEVLEGFGWIMKFKKYEKQRNTYFVGLLEKQRNNRVHGRFNQIGTSSGRGSMSDPNLQNVSTGEKDVYHLRDCFCAPPGYLLIVCDFAQLEYRLLAHFSQDPKLLRAFRENLDLHSLTCYNLYPEVKEAVDAKYGGPAFEALKHFIPDHFGDKRKRAKVLNFEIIYGVGYKKLADQLKISWDEAKQMIKDWFRGYAYVRIWMDKVIDGFRTTGFQRTLAGRIRRADMSRLTNKEYWIRGEEERTLTNALVQGSAMDIVLKATLNIDHVPEIHERGAILVNQVHDELIFECPKPSVKRVIELIRPQMENPFNKPLRVPMPVSIGYGPSWASAKV